MAKKDFSKVNTNKVYEAIEEATAEPVQDAQEKPKKQKERRTYTEQEALEIMQTLKTSGRKGIKLPRINCAFSPENYLYIRTMARVSGMTLTEFINLALEEHAKEHAETYKRAKEFRDSL